MNAAKTAFGLAAILCAAALAPSAFTKSAKPAPAKAAKVVSGVIAGFECGDNCYISIRTDDGADLDALCHAMECAPWVEAQKIPKAMVGREVKATLGKGRQTDAEGKVMGTEPTP